MDYSRILLLSLGSMIQKPISDPPQDSEQPNQVLSALSCPPLGIWCQLYHGTSGFHCLTSASVSPFKCGYWKASPTAKTPVLYTTASTQQTSTWVFDYVVPIVSAHLSFTQLHSKTSKTQLTTQKGTNVKNTQTPLPRLSEDSNLAVALLQ